MSYLLALFASYGLVYAATLPHYKNIYISGTPSPATMAQFKRGAVIVDMRAMNELGDCSQPAVATKLGLKYQRVSFEKSARISGQVVADIDRQVQAAGQKPILLFCKTGNRAAAWLTVHLVRDEKISLEKALALTRPMGLKADMEAEVIHYLRRPLINTSISSM